MKRHDRKTIALLFTTLEAGGVKLPKRVADLEAQLEARESELEAGPSLRLHWQADLEAVREVLDRLVVPHGPGPVTGLDRLALDSDPSSVFVWRLAWLEGHVAHLRSLQPSEVPHE